MPAAAEAAVAVNFVGLHVRSRSTSSHRRRRRCRRSGEGSSEAREVATVCRLHQRVAAAGGDCVADDVVADRRLARWARVRRRVAHRVQCGWWRRVEIMVRRLRRQPEREARVADAAATGGAAASPEVSSQYGR